MKASEILLNVPNNMGYKPTCDLMFFTKESSGLNDKKTLLCQLWVSNFIDIENIWVKVPEKVVTND